MSLRTYSLALLMLAVSPAGLGPPGRSPITAPARSHVPEDLDLLRQLNDGRFSDVVSAARLRAQARPPSCLLYEVLIDAAREQGSLSEVAEELHERASAVPGDPYLVAGAAMARLEQRRYDDAWRLFREAMRRGLVCQEFYKSFVDLSIQAHRTRDIVEAIREDLRGRPFDSWLYFAQGYLLDRLGYRVRAQLSYQEALLKGVAPPATYVYHANILLAQGRYEAAVISARTGATGYGARADPSTYSRVWAVLATALELSGRREESRNAHDRALGIAAEIHSCSLEARLVLDRALVRDAAGQTVWTEEETTIDCTGHYVSPYDEALYLQRLGWARTNAGALEAAEDAVRKSMSLARDADDIRLELSGELRLAVIDLTRGQMSEALERLRRALQGAAERGYLDLEARALIGLANANERLGNFARALDYYRAALRLETQTADRSEEAVVLSNMSVVLRRLGDPGSALVYATRGAELGRGLRVPSLEARLLGELAAALAAAQQFEQAEHVYRAALDVATPLSSPSLDAVLFAGWARVALRLGKVEEARAGFERAHELAVSSTNALIRVQALSGLAFSAWREGNRHKAVTRFEESLALIEATRREIPNHEDRMSYLETREQLYGSLAALLLELAEDGGGKEYVERAFTAAERSRARSLLDVSSVRNRRSSALRTAVEIQESLKGGIAAARSALEEGDLFLEFLLGERESLLWALTKSELRFWRLPPRDEIEQRVVSFLQTASRPPRATDNPFSLHLEESGKLFETLLAPAQEHIARARHLIISPNGVLHLVPFEALTLPEADASPRYLIEALPVSYAPSAAVLDWLRHRTPPGRFRHEFLGFAQPSPNASAPELGAAGLEPIPHVREEVESVARLFPPEASRIYLEEAATEAAVKAESLDRYRLVHFAAHAIADEVVPARSAIFLRQDAPQAEDGALHMEEVLDLKLRADMVVLSGCQTARGRVLRAEGLVGFTWAFLATGASSVVVSLWNVNDQSTAELMHSFYRELAGADLPAEALRRAKLALMRSSRPAYRHPYYWAPFVMVGDFGRGPGSP